MSESFIGLNIYFYTTNPNVSLKTSCRNSLKNKEIIGKIIE